MMRAVTSSELEKLRTPGQWSKLYLAVIDPPKVLQCQVNKTFTSTDMVTDIPYDTITFGAYTDILPGMTLAVGTTSGGHEMGYARVKSATSTTITIGRTSDIIWQDNLYLTVLDEFGLWAKQTKITGTTVYIDDDTPYTDQHTNYNPIVVMGTDRVAELVEGSVNLSFDASSSWCINSTITAYTWSAPGASAISGDDTSAPVVTYDAAGTYRIGCTITAANGKTSSGFRVVYIWNTLHKPTTDFTLSNCVGDKEDGGWSFDVTMYSSAAIRDRAKVILFAEDHYGNETISMGQAEGGENIIAEGWIAAESITLNPQLSTATFSVQGPHWWLSKIPSFPQRLTDVSSTPSNWVEMQSETIDHVVWHLLYWHSTACNVIDITLTGDTRRIAEADATVGSLWEQIKSNADTKILAQPCCDRYGRLYVEIDSQYIYDRSGVPVVMEVEKQDWRDTPEIDRVIVEPVAMVEITAQSWNGTAATPHISDAYGSTFGHYGEYKTRDQLYVSDESQTNQLAGLILAAENIECTASIPLAANNRLLDVCPVSYIGMSIDASDTPRGLTWTDKKLIVRSIEIEYQQGILLTNLECDCASTPITGVTVPIPIETIENNAGETPSLIDFPIFPGLPSYYNPVVVPVNPLQPDSACATQMDYPSNGPFNLYISGTIYTHGKYSITQHFPCVIRSGAADNKTRYTINGGFLKWDGANFSPSLDDSWYTVYGLDSSGNRVCTGIHDAVISQTQRTGYFEPPSAVEISDIEIALTHIDIPSCTNVIFGTLSDSNRWMYAVWDKIITRGTLYSDITSWKARGEIRESMGNLNQSGAYGDYMGSDHEMKFVFSSDITGQWFRAESTFTSNSLDNTVSGEKTTWFYRTAIGQYATINNITDTYNHRIDYIYTSQALASSQIDVHCYFGSWHIGTTNGIASITTELTRLGYQLNLESLYLWNICPTE